MKIVIVNAYLRNNGDAALLSVLIEQLRQAWPNGELTIASLESPVRYPTYDGCENVGSIRLYTAGTDVSKFVRMCRKLLVLGVELLWWRLGPTLRRSATRRLPELVRSELQAIENADLVVSTGGGYLNGTNSLGGNLNVRYVLLPIKLATKLGKVVIMGPQSFGPFGNTYQERAVAATLREVQCVLAREHKSRDILLRIGVPQSLIVDAVDSGFGFHADVVRPSNRGTTRPKVGLTARLWFPSTDRQQAYTTALADFICTAGRRHHADSVLIPQVVSDFEADDDDRVVERRIASLVRERGGAVTQLEDRLDPHELKKLYSGLDFTVGTRFHSVIFSLTSYVPAIAIEYEHKTSGIMQALGLGQWVIGIDDVTADRLSLLFDALISEREAYIKQLKKVLPAYIHQAQQVGAIIRQVYERSLAGADAETRAERRPR